MRELRFTHRSESIHYPERSIDSPERIRHAFYLLKELGLEREDCSRPAYRGDLELVHAPEYLDGLQALAEAGGAQLDPELEFDRPQWIAALASAGTLVRASELALQQPDRAILCLSRPGSHHASSDFALGHCLLNNLAVAAAVCRARQGVERVAIVDFDAHHGNGTQSIFWNDPNVLTVSLHQFPFFPGTGAEGERGGPAALGANLNLTLAAGAGGAEFLDRYRQALAAVRGFAPQLVLFEAGVDAHFSDWTSELRVDGVSFHTLGLETRALLTELGAAAVFELGGGYTEEAIEQGLRALLAGLCGQDLDPRCALEAPAAPPLPELPELEPTELLARLARSGWPLSDVFPYAAQIGQELASLRPELEHQFQVDEPAAAALPLAQARSFAFLRYAEAVLSLQQLGEVLAPVIARHAHLVRELASTVAWYEEV